jgi:hypothetical protein
VRDACWRAAWSSIATCTASGATRATTRPPGHAACPRCASCWPTSRALGPGRAHQVGAWLSASTQKSRGAPFQRSRRPTGDEARQRQASPARGRRQLAVLAQRGRTLRHAAIPPAMSGCPQCQRVSTAPAETHPSRDARVAVGDRCQRRESGSIGGETSRAASASMCACAVVETPGNPRAPALSCQASCRRARPGRVSKPAAPCPAVIGLPLDNGRPCQGTASQLRTGAAPGPCRRVFIPAPAVTP